MITRGSMVGGASQPAQAPFSVRLASPRQRWQYRGLVLAWVLGQISFWSWWLLADHVVTLVGLFVNSLLLVWTTFLPAWYLFFLGRGRQPNPALPLPEGRVAMVVTKAPSEPWPLVRQTLEAMLAQEFPRPYDVWLADEDPTSETRAWCAEHAVQVSCRKGVAGFNNPTWPRREKCKEGNLAYFYEAMDGYHRYDFVSQLDADHVPEPTYLAEIVRAFADPTVGYVAAPSICDANGRSSWAARGRLYAEAALHGALQAGYGSDFAPLCIGSHYAVRTCALRDIGGLGPELAEDFSTTVLMNAGGWRGAFAINAAAHGDGPASIADCVTQEFQWSRSVTSIYLSLWFASRKQIPLPARLQLSFGPIWYFLFTLHLLVGYLLPVFALISGTPWVSVGLAEFWLHASLPAAVGVLTVLWTRRQGWLRPATAPVLSWEAMLFEYVRWPWMLLGIVQALVGHVLGRQFSFRVTPKGASGPRPLPRRVLVPFAGIVALEAGVAILVATPGAASGYVYLAVVAALSYCIVISTLIGLHLRENRRAFSLPRFAQLGALGRVVPLAVLSFAVLSAALLLRGETALATLIPVAASTRVPAAANPTVPLLAVDLPTDHLGIGAYDPRGELDDLQLDTEQRYVRQDDPATLAQFLTDVQNRRTPLVTVEPWPADASGTPVLEQVVDGTSDAQIRALARLIAARQPQTVLIRWGHEMELSDLYPWGAQDPGLYTAAYRHVVELFRDEGASNVRFVWSPAGNGNALQYYPGDDVVDYVGATVLEDTHWDADFGLPPQSFDELFGPRYRLLAPLGKPVIVTELGVSGTSARKSAWLTAAADSLTAYPEVRAVVYFSAVNPSVSRVAIYPDWHLDVGTLTGFAEAVRADPTAA